MRRLYSEQQAWNTLMSKICVVSQRVPFPPNKGEKLRTYHQILHLVESGHQVEVLTLVEDDNDERDAQLLASQLDINVSTYRLPNKVKRYLWAVLKNQPLSVGNFFSTKLQKIIDSKLNQGRDVLMFSASSLSYYIFNSPSYETSSCYLLMDFMDVDSDKWAQYAATSRFPMNWVYSRESEGIRELEAKTNKLFSACFLIAEEEVALFKRNVDASKPVKVLGNGLDFKAFYPSKKVPAFSGEIQTPNFLFTGVMDYKPNIDAVLWFVNECWPTVRSKYSTAVFTIAGMNPVEEIKAFNGKEGIEVTGFVDDILPYFHRANVFVAPFRLARGVQNKVLQAAACALPIVTTSMGAEGISFASNDNMWIEDNAEAFANACISIMENDDASKEKALRAFDAIREQYSWKQQLAPLDKVLSTL